MKIFLGVVVVIVIGAIALLALSPKPSEDLERADVQDVQTDTDSDAEMDTDTDTDNMSDTEMTVSKDDITFGFTGFGPGKSHVGTFTDFSVSNVSFDVPEGDTNIIPTTGTITFDVASIDTDTAILNGSEGHLCAEGFFDCANYPQITFDLVSVEKVAGTETDYNVTGNLEIKGITKQITVPATYAKGFAQANFVVDMTQFNFSGPTVNPEVEISISAILN